MEKINKKTYSELFYIIMFLSLRNKVKLAGIVVFILISSLVDLISIGSIIPLISIVFDIKIINIKLFNNFSEMLKLDNSNKFFITLGFILLIILANLFRISTIYLLTKFSKIVTADFASRIFKHYLYSNLIEIKKKNTSQIISVITERLDIFSALFYDFLYSVSSILLILFVILFLIFINWQITLITIFFILFIYIFFILLIKKKLNRVSKELSSLGFSRIKKIRETLGNFRQMVLDNSQNIFYNAFTKEDRRFREIQFKIQFTNIFPKHIVEATLIILIIALLYIAKTYLEYQLNDIIPIATVFVFSAQKLMPLANNLFNSHVNLSGYSSYLLDIRKQLSVHDYKSRFIIEDKVETYKKIVFNKKIILKNLYFKYPNTKKNIFDGFNLEIKKGSKCALVGSSGSGKTTLLDIIIGIHQIEKGKLIVDDNLIHLNNINSWQENISYVPQDVFLFDESIEKNITLDLESKNLNKERLVYAAKLADIQDFVTNLLNGYETRIGENGALLSGGQKQRLGIARALYKKKPVLILDESTNALDLTAEKKILQNLFNLAEDITIIHVTHRVNEDIQYNQIIKL